MAKEPRVGKERKGSRKMQHHQTRFSVIIPVYNRSRMTTEAIESVLSQGFNDYELIVVDDGSTDETPKMLERFRDRAEIITQRNSGTVAARNRGAEAAKGEYLIFLDNDDLLMPRALRVYDAVISTIGQPSVIAAHFVYFDQCKPLLPTTPDSDVEVVAYKDFLSKDRRVPRFMSCTVVRENIFRHLGGFTVECPGVEDVDFFLRARSCGPAALVIRPPTMAYRIHKGNASNDTKWMAEGMLSLIRREKKGIYPSGGSQLDRYASNGGLVFSFTKKFFSRGYPILGLRVLVAGFPMVFAAAFRLLLIRLRGKAQSVKIKL